MSKAQRALASGKYYAFFVAYMVILSALGSFVNDLYLPALPEMVGFFHTTVPTVQLGLTMGMIGLGVGQLVLGPLSDRLGRKPVLVGSISVFIVGAVVGIFSPTIHFFLGCRVIQGLGASGGYFLARTIPADVYSGRPLAKVMAIIGAINGIAPAGAPILGGIITDTWGWRGAFVALTIFAVIVIALSPMLKESLAPARRFHGTVAKGWSGYLGLLKNRAFMTHTAFKGVALGMLFAYISSSPFILQKHYGLSETVFGLVIGANAVFVAAGSMLALKFNPLKKAAVVGATLLMIASAAQAVALWFVHSIWVFEICAVLMVFSLGMIFSVTNTLAMNEGRQRAGEASAVLGISGYIVGAIVSPLVGIGDIMHSTAITFVILGTITLFFSLLSRRIAPDLDK